MTCIGVDIVEIDRIEDAVARWGERFLNRVYTGEELKRYKRIPSLAARFAGKEAVIKALNPRPNAISWKEIEILSEPDGKPSVRLLGNALAQSHRLGLSGMDISLSHSKTHAIAFVIGTKGQ